MYSFLTSLRQFSPTVKALIVVAAFLSGGPLLIILSVVFLVKAAETDPGKYQMEINTFKNNYDRLRPYVEGTGDNLIYFGSYVCEYEGKTFYGSKYISIYAKNISSAITGAYPFVEQRTIEGDTYYQFPIKAKYSKTAKITIILAMLQYITECYPEDESHSNRDIPIGLSAVGKLKLTKEDGIRNSFTK